MAYKRQTEDSGKASDYDADKQEEGISVDPISPADLMAVGAVRGFPQMSRYLTPGIARSIDTTETVARPLSDLDKANIANDVKTELPKVFARSLPRPAQPLNTPEMFKQLSPAERVGLNKNVADLQDNGIVSPEIAKLRNMGRTYSNEPEIKQSGPEDATRDIEIPENEQSSMMKQKALENYLQQFGRKKP